MKVRVKSLAKSSLMTKIVENQLSKSVVGACAGKWIFENIFIKQAPRKQVKFKIPERF